MAILDQVIQMQKEGKENPEILRALQEQGISASEINEAINQSQIKTALNGNQMENQEQQSIMGSEVPGQVQAPQAQEQQAPAAETPVETTQENYYTQTPQGYDQGYDSGAGYGGTVDPDSVTEIAQQVVEEEFKNYKKKTGDVVSFKATTEEKMEALSSRIKRLEGSIDKMQHAIIQKVGEFGENTNYIRKDLENLHNTTSKLMNPLIDNLNSTKKHGTHRKRPAKKKSKK